MKKLIGLVVALFFIGCASTVKISNSSGVVETWDGKKYKFKGSSIVISDSNVTLVKESKIAIKDIKVIYMIKEYDNEAH